MNREDRKEFYEVWGASWEMYGKSLSPGSMKLAFAALAGLTMDEIKKGIALHMRDTNAGMFPPQPSHIIGQTTTDPQEDALLIWPEVEKLIHGGAHNLVVFEDQIVHQVILDMGGFKALGMIPTKDMQWTKKDFIAQYVAIKQSGRGGFPTNLRLAISQTSNPDYQVLYIGDKEKCLLMIGQGEDEPGMITEDTVRFLTNG